MGHWMCFGMIGVGERRFGGSFVVMKCGVGKGIWVDLLQRVEVHFVVDLDLIAMESEFVILR